MSQLDAGDTDYSVKTQISNLNDELRYRKGYIFCIVDMTVKWTAVFCGWCTIQNLVYMSSSTLLPVRHLPRLTSVANT